MNFQPIYKIFPLCFALLATTPTFAQSNPAPVSCEIPLEIELLAEDAQPRALGVVTADTISQDGLTTPSLWWAAEQIDLYGGRFIHNWIAYPNLRRIDLVVNRQIWSLSDYIGRYTFVSKFGAVAREYGYNLRVFNRQSNCLAIYTCNYGVTPPQCRINLTAGIGERFGL